MKGVWSIMLISANVLYGAWSTSFLFSFVQTPNHLSYTSPSFKLGIINPHAFGSINFPNVLRYSFLNKRFTTFYVSYARGCGHEIFWMPKHVSSSDLLTFVTIARNQALTLSTHTKPKGKTKAEEELKNDLNKCTWLVNKKKGI